MHAIRSLAVCMILAHAAASAAPATQDPPPPSLEEVREFARRGGIVTPVATLQGKKFVAISVHPDAKFARVQLDLADGVYTQFFPYFRERGFTLGEPDLPLEMIIFEKPDDYRTFMRRGPSDTSTGYFDGDRLGIYDLRKSNRYDAERTKAEGVANTLPKRRYAAYMKEVDRRIAAQLASETTMTTAHEAAHQLAAFSGLVRSDVTYPAAVFEGIAMFCEPEQEARWLGIGAKNPRRQRELARALGEKPPFGPLLALDSLIAEDEGVTRLDRVELPSLHRAQSWALLHFLMHQHTAALQKYLQDPPRMGEDARGRFNRLALEGGATTDAEFERYVTRELLRPIPPKNSKSTP